VVLFAQTVTLGASSMADKELLPDSSDDRNLSLDDLFKLHTTICTWTSNADTKTSYGLVFAAVLLGLLIKEVDAGHGLWGGCSFLLLSYVLCDVATGMLASVFLFCNLRVLGANALLLNSGTPQKYFFKKFSVFLW